MNASLKTRAIVFRIESERRRRLATRNLVHRLLQVIVVLLTKLCHAVFAIQPLPDDFICLHELINFTSQLIVLVGNDADMVVHRVDLDLEVSIVLEERTVRVASALKLFAHVQQLVLLLADLHL